MDFRKSSMEDLVMSQKVFNGIFKGKTVLITGHTGFVGSWLTLWLNNLGANVIGYSLNPPTNPALFDILNLGNEITNVVSDIREKEKLFEIVKEYEPEFVFHLAAQSLVRNSYENPLDTFDVNVLGTANMLEALRFSSSVKVGLIMTSDKCYDNKINHRPHVEDDPMGGIDPYSASKGAAELITSSYNDSFFNAIDDRAAISTIRAGNILGGGDWAKDRIVPDSINAIIKNQNIQIRNPDSIRPWQYVLEPISGMLWLARKMHSNKEEFNQSWNFGPNTEQKFLTVKEIADYILNKSNSSLKIDFSGNLNQPFESKRLMIDPLRAYTNLGWKNIYTVDDTLSETIAWYKTYENKQEDMKEFSISQIDNYISRAEQVNINWTK